MRSAAVGFMSLPMTSGAWRTVQAAAARRWLASSGGQLRPRRRPAGSARRDGVPRRSPAPRPPWPARRSPPMASTASVKVAVNGRPAARRGPESGPDSALQRLAGGDDLAPVIVAAMAADVVRPLQLAAIRALGVRLVRQRLDGCGACRGGTARSFSLERPWDCAPPVWVTPCGPGEGRTGQSRLSITQAGPSSRGPGSGQVQGGRQRI